METGGERAVTVAIADHMDDHLTAPGYALGRKTTLSSERFELSQLGLRTMFLVGPGQHGDRRTTWFLTTMTEQSLAELDVVRRAKLDSLQLDLAATILWRLTH